MSSNNENLAIQRIAKLVDENSFMEIGSLVTARSTDFNLTAAKTPSDGVVIGHGLIDGNLVFIYSQDASVLNGTIGDTMDFNQKIDVSLRASLEATPVERNASDDLSTGSSSDGFWNLIVLYTGSPQTLQNEFPSSSFTFLLGNYAIVKISEDDIPSLAAFPQVIYIERPRQLFFEIVSARQVAHGKPAPDVYLYACSQLHVQPQECYAVEDSPNGIHSAYSAGCKVFMVPDLTQPDAELEKFIYKKVESLVALKEYF